MTAATVSARMIAGSALLLLASVTAMAQDAFNIEEATIASTQKAIQDGRITCQGVVQAYIERIKAYNGTCTALVTADGKPFTFIADTGWYIAPAIDFNVLVPGSFGYSGGDFNYDGAITGDDYSAIDFNILAQGAPFSTSGSAGLSGVTPVPEPTHPGRFFLDIDEHARAMINFGTL